MLSVRALSLSPLNKYASGNKSSICIYNDDVEATFLNTSDKVSSKFLGDIIGVRCNCDVSSLIIRLLY